MTPSMTRQLYYLFSCSCSLIHHATRPQVTVVEQEAVVAATGRHEVRHRLPSSEVGGLNDLWRQFESLRGVVSGDDVPTGKQTVTVQSELMCRALVTTVWEEMP